MFQRPKFAEKSQKFQRKNDVQQIQAPNRKFPAREKNQFHPPSHSTAPADSLSFEGLAEKQQSRSLDRGEGGPSTAVMNITVGLPVASNPKASR